MLSFIDSRKKEIKMFEKITYLFKELLKEENNSYKYVKYYEKEINNIVDEIEKIVYMIKMIYDEKTKTRYHTNDAKARVIEKIIICHGIEILQSSKYKSKKIKEINEIFIEERNIEYVNNTEHGFILNNKIDLIEDISWLNSNDIYFNLNNIIKLKKFNNFEYNNEKIKKINDYVLCIYYCTKY